MSNQELIEKVKTWLDIDNQIKELQAEIKIRRNLKKELTKDLVGIMNNNDLDSMNTSQGQLIKTTRKVKAPLSKKHLISSISTFFKEDAEITAALCKHIMETRNTQIKENIRRKLNK